MKEFDVGVEEVTLGDVDAFEAELVNELNDAGGDGGLAHGRYVGEGALGGLFLQHDAVQLRHVELVGGGARRHVKGEALARDDGVRDLQDEGLNVGLHRGEGQVRHLAAPERECQVLEC